jgi:hypothetical protein
LEQPRWRVPLFDYQTIRNPLAIIGAIDVDSIGVVGLPHALEPNELDADEAHLVV